jgi:HK97 gp10 family phage protein
MNELIKESDIARALDRIGAFVRDEAKRRCPVDNGVLRSSLQYRVEGDSVRIFSDLDYSKFIEYGTGVFHINEKGQPEPHIGWDIVPVNKKALEPDRKRRLAEGGKKNMIFAKKVHIEGMHAQPFLRPAVHQNMKRISEIFKEEMS